MVSVWSSSEPAQSGIRLGSNHERCEIKYRLYVYKHVNDCFS
nr:MAG TPA: hypothetical protein [Caudoviricetes sp.]